MTSLAALQMYQQWLKLSRHYGISNIVILHKMGDLDAVGDADSQERNLAYSIVGDIENKFVFRVNHQEHASLRDRLQMPTAHVDMARQLRKGEFLAYVGQYSYLVDCFATSTEWEYDLFKTDDAMLPDRRSHGIPTSSIAPIPLDDVWPVEDGTDLAGWLTHREGDRMTIATRPLVYANVSGDTAEFTSIDGNTESLHAAPAEDIRASIVRRAIAEAQVAGSELELVTSGDRGDHRLLIHTDGSVEGVKMDEPVEESAEGATDVATDDGATDSEHPTTAPRRSHRAPILHHLGGRVGDVHRPQDGAPSSLVSASRFVPSAEELRREADQRAVAQHWAGCRTIAVANGKGGVGKTMTTAMLSAVFARYGGGPVLAWDNNDTRGTLGWRTESGRYDSTVQDLLPAADWLLSPDAPISDIANYVHHQTQDRYDVLRSNPELLAAHQRIDSTEFDLLMRVAARYYRMVVFDSGNDESAERWLRMVDCRPTSS